MGDLMKKKIERGNPAASREFIDWIRQNILDKNPSYIFNLIKHAFYFSLTILIIWYMIKLTEHLFSNIPLAIKILIFISEIIIIFHFAKENISITPK
jgi:predicted metallopeptidase